MSKSSNMSAVGGVVIVSPGGLAGGDGGGMGSVTRVMHSWLTANRPKIRVDVLDARGEGRALFWPLRLLFTALQLITLRIAHRPRILHLQLSRRSSFTRKGILLIVGRAIGMKVVVHHHGSAFIEFYRAASGPMRAWVSWIVHLADMNIVLGQRWQTFLTDELDVSTDRIVIQFNAAQDFAVSADHALRDPWHLLIAANLSPRKGVRELLKAVARVAEAGAPVRLTLAGGGEIERYKQEAAELGIADRCMFAGWVSGQQLHDHFVTHGVMVLPSFAEGLPMAIIEALGAGLPVIATPVGSIPELLEDNVSCLFVTPGNVDELVTAITRMGNDSKLRQRLVERGRQLYETKFEIDGYMTQMLRLYDALLAG